MPRALTFEDYLRLFERCVDLIEHVPSKDQGKLIDIAEGLLTAAGECTSDEPAAAYCPDADESTPTQH